MKRSILFFFVILVLSSAHVLAATTADKFEKRWQHFQLFTNCEPMRLIVEDVSQDAAKFGLTEESIKNTVESRIRSARLFGNHRSKAFLYVNVNVGGPAYSISVEFNKFLFDPVTLMNFSARTWHSSSMGIHGRYSGHILSTISRHIDRFLVEFLRVNDEACRKKK